MSPTNVFIGLKKIQQKAVRMSTNFKNLKVHIFSKKGFDKVYVLAFCMQIFLLFCSSSDNHFLFGLKTLANSNKYCKKKVSLKNFYLEILGSQG